MKKPNVLVFDDFVYAIGPAAAVFTDTKFNEFLGRLDQTAMFAVADSTVGAAAALSVQLQHSPDGRNWSPKNAAAEINNQAIPVGATTALVGIDPGTAPSAANVRLAVWLGGAGSSGHIKISVCDRDQA
jgi:hypothetical protein